MQVRTATRGPYRLITREADVADFRALVPAIDTGGRCQSLPAYPRLEPGQRPLLYTFGPRGRATRNVMVIADSAGQAVRFSDLRGDLRGSPDSAAAAAFTLGPRTTISINVLEQTGMLRNLGAGIDSVALRVRGPRIFDAPNLGTPATMIARILKECGSRVR